MCAVPTPPPARPLEDAKEPIGTNSAGEDQDANHEDAYTNLPHGEVNRTTDNVIDGDL